MKRNYFTEEINQNELISKMHKNVCKILSCIEHLLIFASAVTGWTSISAVASLVCIHIGTASSAVAIKFFALTAGIKK